MAASPVVCCTSGRIQGYILTVLVEEYRAIYLLMHAVLVEEGLYTN